MDGALGLGTHKSFPEDDDNQAGAHQRGAGEAAAEMSGQLAADVDPEQVAAIARNVQVEMASQLKGIMEEMNRLKGELYSDQGGLGEIQRSLQQLKAHADMAEAAGREDRNGSREEEDSEARESEGYEDDVWSGSKVQQRRSVQFSKGTSFREKQPRPPGMTAAQQRAIELARMRCSPTRPPDSHGVSPSA
jgi:hypothetical protein